MNKYKLTNREYDVWKLIAQGFDNAYISKSLFVESRTIERHIGSIFSKIEAPNGIHKRVWVTLKFLEETGKLISDEDAVKLKECYEIARRVKGERVFGVDFFKYKVE